MSVGDFLTCVLSITAAQKFSSMRCQIRARLSADRRPGHLNQLAHSGLRPRQGHCPTTRVHRTTQELAALICFSTISARPSLQEHRRTTRTKICRNQAERNRDADNGKCATAGSSGSGARPRKPGAAILARAAVGNLRGRSRVVLAARSRHRRMSVATMATQCDSSS